MAYIDGQSLTVVKGCDNNGRFVQTDAPGNQIAVIARNSLNGVDEDDEHAIYYDEQCAVRPALYIGKDLIGDAYVSEEESDSKTTAIGGIPEGLTPTALLQMTQGSLAKTLDMLLFPDVKSVVTAPTMSLAWATGGVNKTVTLASGVNTYTISPNDFKITKTTGQATWCSTTETGVPQASLSLGHWRNLNKFYYGTSSTAVNIALGDEYIAQLSANDGTPLKLYFKVTDNFVQDELYLRNKKATISEQPVVTYPNEAGNCVLTVHAPCLTVALNSANIANANGLPTKQEAINALNASGQIVNLQTWGEEASGTSYIEKGSYYVPTTVPDSVNNYFRIWAIPSAYTCRSYVQSDNINNYSNTFTQLGTAELTRGALSVIYKIYVKTSADSSNDVVINAYYNI